jgi:hypothetical protein
VKGYERDKRQFHCPFFHYPTCTIAASIKSAMTAKTESSKLSPAERLARKRAAARLRQQRCRARKRQATLEKRRLETEHQPNRVGVTPESTTGSSRSTMVMPLPTHPRHHPHHRIQHQIPHRIPAYGHPLPKPSHPSQPTSGEHIYNCISFESQRSFEEAQKTLRVQTTSLETVSEKSVAIVSPSSSPPRHPDASIVRVLSEEKPEEHLVPEEEAAVAAMLSLKSGSDKSFLFSKGDEDRDQPPASPPLAPKVVEQTQATVVESATTSTASTKPALVGGMSKIYSAPSPAAVVIRRHPLHLRPTEVPSHYEIYEYGPPPARMPPRRVSHPAYYHHHRVSAGPPPPPPYRRGYYAAPSPAAQRSYTIRYDYE